MWCVPLYQNKRFDSVWTNTHRGGTCLDTVVYFFTRVCQNPDGVQFPPPVKEDRRSKGVDTRSLGRVHLCKCGGKHGPLGCIAVGTLLSTQRQTQET